MLIKIYNRFVTIFYVQVLYKQFIAVFLIYLITEEADKYHLENAP